MAVVKVRDNQSGQIFEVDESELGNYGLTPQDQSYSTQQPAATPQVKTITGRGLEEHAQALQRAKAAGDTAAIKQITDDYDREFQYQKEYNKKPDAAKLRQEFSKETKDSGFEEAQKSWNKASSAQKTGAGDLTIIYSYIKALDPTSVVREGEINLTKAAESIPNNILRAYQRAKEGKIMSDELRQEMKNELGLLYNERARKQQELNAFYSGLATDMGFDPKDVIGKVGEIKLAELSQMERKQEQTSIPGALGEFLFKAGKTIAEPFITTGRNVATAAVTIPQAAGVSALERVSPQLAGQLASKDIFGTQKELERQTLGERAKEQLGASVELALPKLLGMAGGRIGRVIPKKGATAAIAEATGKLKTSKVIEAGNKFVSHEPAAKELWEVVKPTIKKETPASDLLAKMFDVWKGAYTKTGDVRTTAEAKLYNKLYGAGRKVIEEQAPQLSSEISKLKFLHQLPGQVQKGSWLALKGTAIGKLLFGL